MSGEYVSRDYLLAEYDRQHQGPPGGARKIIAEAPAADVVKRLRWIPVTERLPDGIALAVNAMQGSYGYREYLIGYIGKNEASDSGYSCESDGEILMNVTHWMPLPEPPEEET